MYTLTIEMPEKTRAGKVAQRARYRVTHSSGNKDPVTMTVAKFCERKEISLVGLLRQVRGWGSGTYGEALDKVVEEMQKRTRGAYANHGRSNVCPKCGHEYRRMEGVYARRRKLRDASPPNHILRAMDPSYFGEQPGYTEPGTPEAPGSLQPAGVVGSPTISAEVT